MSTPYSPPSGPPAPGAGSRGVTASSGKAVLALVLAVLAWTPVVPFLGAIGALVLASMARREIAASAGRVGGQGLVTAAQVLSWVHLAFVAALFLVLLLALLGVFTVSLFGLSVG